MVLNRVFSTSASLSFPPHLFFLPFFAPISSSLILTEVPPSSFPLLLPVYTALLLVVSSSLSISLSSFFLHNLVLSSTALMDLGGNGIYTIICLDI